MSSNYVRFTMYVNMITKRDGNPIEVVFSESVKAQINEQIQQTSRIVTCYETLEEYRFDISGIKYMTRDVHALAGTVERLAYETNEIVLLMEPNFFAKKKIPGLDDENITEWTEEMMSRFEVVPRGLIKLRTDPLSGTVRAFIERFVSFDLIPKQKGEER